MVISVICHFSCFSNIMTSDKFIYLFGKIIPSLALIFSMVLGFIPKFTAQIKKVSSAQKALGGYSSKSVILKCRHALSVLSIMVTWSLENAIETADSMKSRGYGLSNRTAFSNFKFDRRDAFFLIFLIVSAIYILLGAVGNALHFAYFPLIQGSQNTVYQCSIFIFYLLLFFTPILIEGLEGFKWKLLKQKI